MLTQIKNILFSKPHNAHYLERYYKFIITLIEENVNEGYTERHHICPKASDLFPEYSNLKLNSWNKIRLTPRQHFIAHWLLWKAYGGSQRYAFLCMVRGVKNKYQQDRVNGLNSKTYDKLKKEQYISTSGENNYFFHHKFVGEKNGFYGKTHTQEFKAYISSIHKNKVESEETRKKKSQSRFGKKHNDSVIQKMKSLKWFHDPITGKQYKSADCPDGCIPGRK